MADYIRAAVELVISAISAETPTLLAGFARPLEPFVEVKMTPIGVAINSPACYVMPDVTNYDIEGNPIRQYHQVIVRLAIAGTDPEELVGWCFDYVKAVHEAVENAGVGATLRTFVVRENFGPLRVAKGFAMFPEITVAVDMEEYS